MTLIAAEPMFRAHVEVAEPRLFGKTPYGERRVIDILGGRVEGPRLNGRILPGADWQIICPDGTADLTARYGIETETRRPRPGQERRPAPRPARGAGGAGARRTGRSGALLFPHRAAVRGLRPVARLAQPHHRDRPRRTRQERGAARGLRGALRPQPDRATAFLFQSGFIAGNAAQSGFTGELFGTPPRLTANEQSRTRTKNRKKPPKTITSGVRARSKPDASSSPPGVSPGGRSFCCRRPAPARLTPPGRNVTERGMTEALRGCP